MLTNIVMIAFVLVTIFIVGGVLLGLGWFLYATLREKEWQYTAIIGVLVVWTILFITLVNMGVITS